jgi:hypothetical protein
VVRRSGALLPCRGPTGTRPAGIGTRGVPGDAALWVEEQAAQQFRRHASGAYFIQRRRARHMKAVALCRRPIPGPGQIVRP